MQECQLYAVVETVPEFSYVEWNNDVRARERRTYSGHSDVVAAFLDKKEAEKYIATMNRLKPKDGGYSSALYSLILVDVLPAIQERELV